MSASDFFIKETLSHVHSMRIGEAREFLHGLLEVAGEGNSDVEEVRRAYVLLNESHLQLELISSRLSQP